MPDTHTQEDGGIYVGNDITLCPECRSAYQNGISIRSVKDFLSILCEDCLPAAESLFVGPPPVAKESARYVPSTQPQRLRRKA